MQTEEQTTLLLAAEPHSDEIHRTMLAMGWPARIIRHHTVDAAVSALASYRPTTFVVEVDGPKGDGFQLIREAAERMESSGPIESIVLGSCASHAIRAFEMGAMDYVLLPSETERVTAALAKLRDAIRSSQIDALNDRLRKVLEMLVPADDRKRRDRSGNGRTFVERIGIRVGNRWVVVRAREIQCITGAGVYVQIVARGQTFLLRATMAEVEARLDPDRFVRIHRSTIVNTDHLKEVFLHRRGEYVIVMDDGSHLKASRSYGERIRELVDTVG